ncbi:MAG: hypothetical protein JWP91_1364 [Fibrobacteres bacterium]|nr:hypothetical protein [Fibrobacterota bacterium]
MSIQKSGNMRDAVGKLEVILADFEAILEETQNRPLYKASLCLVDALTHLHEMDATLLDPETRLRVEALIEKAKPKPGRNTFNTGF